MFIYKINGPTNFEMIKQIDFGEEYRSYSKSIDFYNEATDSCILMVND